MSILNILGIEETEKFQKLKECSKCKKLKNINYFRKRGEGNDKKRVYPICKECEKRINKDVVNLRKCAPPKPEYCDCCGKKCEKFVLDHDHELNKFRGWICDSCNIGISRLGDNLDGVMKAVKYLEQHETNVA